MEANEKKIFDDAIKFQFFFFKLLVQRALNTNMKRRKLASHLPFSKRYHFKNMTVVNLPNCLSKIVAISLQFLGVIPPSGEMD